MAAALFAAAAARLRAINFTGQLPDGTHNELVYLDTPSYPLRNPLPFTTSDELADLTTHQDEPADLLISQDKPVDLTKHQDKPTDLTKHQDRLTDLTTRQEKPINLTKHQDSLSNLTTCQEKTVDLTKHEYEPANVTACQDKPVDLTTSQAKPVDLTAHQGKEVDITTHQGKEVDPTTHQDQSICYINKVKSDNNRPSIQPQIDEVTIPPHLVHLIQRDQYDLSERENSRVATRLGHEYRHPSTSASALREYYHGQSSGTDNVEVVFYRQDRQRDGVFSAGPVYDGMDDCGRMIERAVWPLHRDTTSAHAKTSITNHQRARSPTPIRKPVFLGARQPAYSFESTLYQSQTPASPPAEPTNYVQTRLFSSALVSTNQTANPSLHGKAQRKNKLAARQARLQRERGGVVMDLGFRMLRRGASPYGAEKVAEEYAAAFAGWDEALSASPAMGLQGYTGSERRRAWFRTMLDMPEKERTVMRR